MSLPLLVVLAVVTMTVTEWAVRSAIRDADSAAELLHRQVAARLQVELDHLFETPERLLAVNLVAARDGLVDLDDPDALERRFAVQLRAFSTVASLVYVGADGRCACADRDHTAQGGVRVREVVDEPAPVANPVNGHAGSGALRGQMDAGSVPDLPWYRLGADHDDVAWCPISPFVSGGPLGVGVAQSTRGPDGAVHGVMAASLSLYEIERLVADLDLPRGGVAFVIDEQGRLIGDSRGLSPVQSEGRERGLHPMADSDDPVLRHAAALILGDGPDAQNDGGGRRFDLGDDTYLLTSLDYRRPGGLRLAVGIVTPGDASSRQLTRTVMRALGLVAPLALVGLIVAHLVARAIVRPIRDLETASQRIASGDCECPVPACSIGELSELGRSFAAMVDRNRSTTVSLEERLEQRAAELADAREQISRLSRTDDLTGLANRRSFEEEIEKEWSRSRRDRRPISLLVCDVDWFKAFNDCYGHSAGDQCLKSVAEVLSSVARRRTDLVARIGGEEFVALLPGLDPDRASDLGESLRRQVEALDIEHEESPFRRVTVSVGVITVIAPDGGEPDPGAIAAVDAADRALYRAKRLGRNRVAVAG